MQNVKSIVVGIDFMPGSAAAILEAVRLAQWTRASIHAVHVIDTLVAMELEEALSAFQKNICEGLIADARSAWIEFSKNVKGADAISLDVRVQNRVAGILASCREHGADLLVLGAFGAQRAEVGFGTVATSCVRHATCKVLLVRDTQATPFKTVVAAVDFSRTSLAALDQAARIATQDGAALHILHVFDAPWHKLHYRAPTPEADPHFQIQYRHALERRLAAFSGDLGREISFLKPTYAVFDHQGHRSGIVDYARRVDADLIVLGTRGRTSLRDLLLGSTAEKALRDSTCSVLAVKPEDDSNPLAAGANPTLAQDRASL